MIELIRKLFREFLKSWKQLDQVDSDEQGPYRYASVEYTEDSINDDSKKVELEYTTPVNRVKMKPTTKGELTCKYCDKQLVNQNAHSGHMRSCRTSLGIRRQFLEENRAIFESDEEALKRWNSLDHSYFNLFEYETHTSSEALAFIKSNVPVICNFPDAKLKEYCVFYLVVLAQVADRQALRAAAFGFLVELLSEEEVTVLKKYWKGLGTRRYEPSVESYPKTWEKFVRIKDDCFFNIDYPAWILFLDRYILTYKMFGWVINSADAEAVYFRDIVLFNMVELLKMEQYYIDLPNTSRFQSHIPTDIFTFLHSSSRERFSRDYQQYSVKLSNMPYDPRDPQSALFI